MEKRQLMLGNEAIARGLVENNCKIATSYPGTPASEILSSVAILKKNYKIPIHTQWAINEKVAFEIAYAGSMAGLRTAVSMKQVGLNVASDALMSAAYLGTKGGFLVISADDPGPHSSQTEQDSRMMAMMAKIPVLDPNSPTQAKQMIQWGYELSETYRIPVMIRPTTRVCHARQDIKLEDFILHKFTVEFEKDPTRWAATPKFRYQLHQELEEKLSSIAENPVTQPLFLNPHAKHHQAILVSGVAAAHAIEIITERKLWDHIPIYQVIQPYPLHRTFISHILNTYEDILVIEETTGVIEIQLADRRKIKGKLTGHVSRVGELVPEIIEEKIVNFAHIQPVGSISFKSIPGRRPTLCPGCPHRASFFAIKKAVPKGIYTSDIGCYTLGLNLGAVDTVLCMGAAISQASGFYQAYKDETKPPNIVATIGDSTFFHAGIPALIDAVVQKIPITLVILDNRTTAMTGNQPTPASGFGATGESLDRVDIPPLIAGCGVKFCKEIDPYHIPDMVKLIKEAVTFSKANNSPSVIIAKHPCLLDRYHDKPQPPKPVEISDTCDGCGFCVKHFECPALILNESEKRVYIDALICRQCGVCIDVCPKKSIKEKLPA